MFQTPFQKKSSWRHDNDGIIRSYACSLLGCILVWCSLLVLMFVWYTFMILLYMHDFYYCNQMCDKNAKIIVHQRRFLNTAKQRFCHQCQFCEKWSESSRIQRDWIVIRKWITSSSWKSEMTYSPICLRQHLQDIKSLMQHFGEHWLEHHVMCFVHCQMLIM